MVRRDSRTGPGGVHDQIEGRGLTPRPVGQATGVGRDHLAACGDLDTGLHHCLMQDVKQGGAVDAQGLTRAMQVAVADIQNHPAATRLPPEDVVDGLGQLRDGEGQTQVVHNRQTRGLQHEARADGTCRLEPFEQGDSPPFARLHQGEGQAGGARPDDGDVLNGRQAGTSSIRSSFDSAVGQGMTSRQRAGPIRSSTAIMSRSGV